MLIGYARVSTRISQDVEHQRRQLSDLGIPDDRIYLDHGYSGTNTRRPGLELALAALREGDTLVVTKLDRLARSVIDAHHLAQEITGKGAALRFGGSTYAPNDPAGRLFFTMLAAFAEFERDLISQRTKDGLVTAKLRGRLVGPPPKLTKAQEKVVVRMVTVEDVPIGEVAQTFNVSRSTVYRALDRAGVRRGGPVAVGA